MMPKPEDYLPKETLDEIQSNISAVEAQVKILEAAITDAKKVGIDVLSREEELKAHKDWLRRFLAVYGHKSV